MTKAYSLETVLTAIEGSGGITLTIAQRLGCDWATARKYVNRWETSRTAFDAEGQKVLDVAESVLHRNIRIAYNQQRDPATGEEKLVDTSDAKWLLARKGKSRGYADKQEVEMTGDQPITFRVVREDDKDKDA